MKKTGCEYVNYGIESLDSKLLQDMRKNLTLDQIHKGVQAALNAGISPGLNFIWGFPGDTVDNLWKAVEFLKKYDPCDELRTIRPVTPYPGCELYKLAIEKGLLEGPEDFYENKHKNSDLVTVNLTDIPTDEMHRQLWFANQALYKNFLEKRKRETWEITKSLYVDGDTSFRGFRMV